MIPITSDDNRAPELPSIARKMKNGMTSSRGKYILLLYYPGIPLRNVN
jgi:hypothetical protein